MLKARVITAILLAAGLLGALFFLPPLAVAALFAAVAALAGWEWAGLLKLKAGSRLAYGAAIGLSCALAGKVSSASWLMLPAAGFWFLVAPLWLWRRWPLADMRFFGLLLGWILIVATWLAMVALHGAGPWVLLGAMALVWVADTAAYFAGRAFGRRKLAPAISPGKTWEGVIGAVAAVLAYGFGLAAAGFPGAAAAALAPLLILLTAVSIEGDLLESLFKRQAGIKDSSNLLPGHGGVLDRIDSQLSTLPVLALLLQWRAA